MNKVRNHLGQTEKEFLDLYNINKYSRPSVTTDMLIFTAMDKEKRSYREDNPKELKLLLIKRKDHPEIGKWALPGGFIKLDETLRVGALRELKGETNVEDVYIEQLYTWDEYDSKRFQRDKRGRIISCSYMTLVDSTSLKVKAGDDAEDARWFTVETKVVKEDEKDTPKGFVSIKTIELLLTNEDIVLKSKLQYTRGREGKNVIYEVRILESDDIAFDHSKIIRYSIERLRNKLEYTDIAFNLMPEYFSITDLRKVYEVILGYKIKSRANFERKVKHMLIETDKKQVGVGHNPAKLYKFNPRWVKKIF